MSMFRCHKHGGHGFSGDCTVCHNENHVRPKQPADAFESSGELPEHEGSCHTRLDTPRQVHACNCDWPKRMRTAYSALAARLYRSDEMWKEWQEKCVASEGELSRTLKLSEGVNVACAEYRKLLKQAESRIAELERDAERLTELEEIFKNCPTANIIYNDDEDVEDKYGMVSVGFTLQIYGVEESVSFAASTLRDLIDVSIDAQLATDKGEG